MEEFSKQESFFFSALAIAIIAVSLALVFFILQSKVPETFTELYFEANSVQGTASVGPLPTTFLVENHEGEEMDYTYWLVVNGEIAREARLSLLDGEKRRVDETVSLSKPGENQKIEVRLKNAYGQAYSIFFWVDVVQ